MANTMLERRRVNAAGAVTGLEGDEGRDVVIFHLPDFDAWERRAEDGAERLARDLEFDPTRARNLVHDAAETAKSAAQAAVKAWDQLLTPMLMAQAQAEDLRALRDVAEAARRGGADWTATPEDAGVRSHGTGRHLRSLP